MDLQGSSTSLQGGGNIQVGTPAPTASPAPSPALDPTNLSGISSGPTSVLGATTTASTSPASDPAAVAAAAAAAAQQAKITQAIQFGTANAIAAGDAGTASGKAALEEAGNPDIALIKNQQSNIDLARREIGTNQINTIRQLMNTIRQGLFGTGVQLGNTNALSSSARDAASRAYANYGNVETNAANNKAADANLAQDVQQTELGNTREGYVNSLKAARDGAVATIQGNAIAALNNLGTLVSVYLGGDASKINAPAIQAQIVQSAQDQLAQVDAQLEAQLTGVNPTDREATATAAEAASNAGVQPSGSTPFSSTAPPSAATTPDGGAAPPSLIPLTLGKPQTDQTGA